MGMDSVINQFFQNNAVPLSVGTGLASLFASKIVPQLPPKAYDMLDHPLVQILGTTLILNTSIHKPSWSLGIALTIVLGVKYYIRHFAPDTPSISQLTKPKDHKDHKDGNPPTCNCVCNSPGWISR